jgi:hypothetical protein
MGILALQEISVALGAVADEIFDNPGSTSALTALSLAVGGRPVDDVLDATRVLTNSFFNMVERTKVSDAGESADVMAGIIFGSCWNRPDLTGVGRYLLRSWLDFILLDGLSPSDRAAGESLVDSAQATYGAMLVIGLSVCVGALYNQSSGMALRSVAGE